MTHDPRPHIQRRRRAIGRLRSLTAGAAIAGLAGTAGFGILAAASWSGTAARAASNSDAPGSGLNGTGTGTGDSGTSGIAPRVAPNNGAAIQPPTTTAPRVQRGSGPGHASSGGSN